MASKLKADELRAELSLRGLSTSGIKPTLAKRLEAAIRSEEKKSKENVSTEEADTVGKAKAGRKRKRGSGNSELVKGPSDSVEADTVGKAKAGRKRKRGSGNSEPVKGPSDSVENLEKNVIDEEPEENREEKLVTATQKGGAVLDKWLPEHIKSSFHVLQQGGEFYDAALNQTNVGGNNNKFYVIQALESDDGGKFMVYNRWGRVGVRGQEKLLGPFTSQERALKEFEKKFSDKTKNQWSNRKSFINYPKSYTWLEMDYDDTRTDQFPNKARESVGSQLRETKLECRIAKFISLICNISMMKQQMLEIGYNAEKLPLGKLSKSTILKGYDVLRRISDVIGKASKKTLEELSGEFYTVIPHDFGFKKMREFVIDTPYKLKCKLEMVSALGEIEIATKILKDGPDISGDPLYSHYQSLCCELIPVDIDSKEFSVVEKYMQNTHAQTHSGYTVDIAQLFRVSRYGEDERFRKFSNVKNRMLLWHGSRLTNWTGILSQGLRIAPPEAPVTGYMFGKGVYFADMFSKSANYCFASCESRAGVLLLCEVALGDMVELLDAKYDANLLPEGKLSTKGVGHTAPDTEEFEILEDGLVVPLGKPKERHGPRSSLRYNEYIVYNVEQIRMRYVIHVDFNFKR